MCVNWHCCRRELLAQPMERQRSESVGLARKKIEIFERDYKNQLPKEPRK